MVLSQVKLPNFDCWGPGESIDTHVVGVWNKKGKVTFVYPRCPQGPGGPESAQNANLDCFGPGESVGTYIVGVEIKKGSDLWLPSVSSVSRWS